MNTELAPQDALQQVPQQRQCQQPSQRPHHIENAAETGRILPIQQQIELLVDQGGGEPHRQADQGRPQWHIARQHVGTTQDRSGQEAVEERTRQESEKLEIQR